MNLGFPARSDKERAAGEVVGPASVVEGGFFIWVVRGLELNAFLACLWANESEGAFGLLRRCWS